MKRWSLILFAAGILSGLILISLATWADQEASLFELTSAYDKNLSSLRCPLMIARDEESSISVTVKNPSTYTVNPPTTAHITSGYVLLINEFMENPSLPPGGEVFFSWPIESADAAYNTLVLARVFVERSYPLPSRTNSCGVLVLPFGGIPGQAVSAFLVLLSLAGMTLGLVSLAGEARALCAGIRIFLRVAGPGDIDPRWLRLYSTGFMVDRPRERDPDPADHHRPCHPILGRYLEDWPAPCLRNPSGYNKSGIEISMNKTAPSRLWILFCLLPAVLLTACAASATPVSPGDSCSLRHLPLQPIR